MLNVSDENLNLKNEDLKSYLEYYNRLGKPLVEEYTNELDEKVNSFIVTENCYRFIKYNIFHSRKSWKARVIRRSIKNSI